MASPPVRGWCKPMSGNRHDPNVFPCAALEKIASDIAHKLGLPVPPVTLLERLNAAAGEPRHHAISLPPFPSVSRWEAADASLRSMMEASAAPAMSAMIAFDTWLECQDHVNHPGNLLFNVTSSVPPEAALAYIDYSYSMLHTWKASGYRSNFVAPIYHGGYATDVTSLSETVAAIEAVTDGDCDEVIAKVPDGFLSQPDRALLRDGLRYRRDNLRSAIRTAHPGVST
jgi:hypothetical protein